MASEKKKIILRAVLTTLTGALIGWIFSNSLKNAESSSSQSGAVLRAIQNFFDVLSPAAASSSAVTLSAKPHIFPNMPCSERCSFLHIARIR